MNSVALNLEPHQFLSGWRPEAGALFLPALSESRVGEQVVVRIGLFGQPVRATVYGKVAMVRRIGRPSLPPGVEVYLDRAQRKDLTAQAAPDLAAFLRGLSLVPIRPGALALLVAGSFDRRLGVLVVGKDKAGRDRKIKLPPQTAEFFTAHSRGKTPAAPLLARADGKAWTKDSWKKPLRAAAMAAKVGDSVTAYTLRHSVITDLVTGGLDLLTVAQLSGTSVLMIERHYGHYRADLAAAALAGLAL